jgi:hypothetical protein
MGKLAYFYIWHKRIPLIHFIYKWLHGILRNTHGLIPKSRVHVACMYLTAFFMSLLFNFHLMCQSLVILPLQLNGAVLCSFSQKHVHLTQSNMSHLAVL